MQHRCSPTPVFCVFGWWEQGALWIKLAGFEVVRRLLAYVFYAVFGWG